MAPQKRALIAVTSATPEFYPGGKKTGLYWSEALHPYNVFKDAGYEIDVVSENPSSFGYDATSISDEALDPESKEAWNDPKHPLRGLLKTQLQHAASVDASKYQIFFAAGGHGAIYDFPKATKLHKLGAEVYAHGGVVAAVCHGPAVLPGIKDLSTGKPLIQGKRVTGFAEKGEVELGAIESMRRDGAQTIEEQVKAVGGNYIEPPTALGDFTEVDGRLVTGVNPASAKSTAQKSVKVVQSL